MRTWLTQTAAAMTAASTSSAETMSVAGSPWATARRSRSTMASAPTARVPRTFQVTAARAGPMTSSRSKCWASALMRSATTTRARARNGRARPRLNWVRVPVVPGAR
ncbi:hypothetical protein AB6O49_33000 [Streptomyces sp. SBR177]